MAVPARQAEIAQSLRSAARRFATGVAVVAIADGEKTHAMTANSFVTLSLDPPLIGLTAVSGKRLSSLVERVRSFGISVLNESQCDYAKHYASNGRVGVDPGLAFTRTGHDLAVPLIPDCVAYFVCELRSAHPVGDHDLFIGLVLECDAQWPGPAPLVFLDGAFRSAAASAAWIKR